MENQAPKKKSCPWIKQSPQGVILRVHVQPGAKRDEVSGLHGNRVKIRIQAPPQDGRANKYLCRYIAKLTQSSKNSVEILRGGKSRAKDLLLRDTSTETVNLWHPKLRRIWTDGWITS